MKKLGQNGKNESGSRKPRNWDGFRQVFQAKTMTNARCGKPCVFGQPWEAGVSLASWHAGLEPMATQGDYCHGPNCFYRLDPCIYLYLLPVKEPGLGAGLLPLTCQPFRVYQAPTLLQQVEDPEKV